MNVESRMRAIKGANWRVQASVPASADPSEDDLAMWIEDSAMLRKCREAIKRQGWWCTRMDFVDNEGNVHKHAVVYFERSIMGSSATMIEQLVVPL